MKTPEFDSLNKEIGDEVLAPVGYEYKNGNWHYLTGEYQLSFILGKDKNASHFQVKYLTLCLRHLDVPMGDSNVKLKPFSDLDGACPVQISPQNLEEYINSNFSPEHWRYANSHQDGRPIEIYQPIYFGGLDKWIMKDKSYSEEVNQQHLKKSIEQFGADFISEEESKEVLKTAISNVAKYGVSWAEHMTPKEIISQIQNNGDGWWVEKEWVEKYSQTFGGE